MQKKTTKEEHELPPRGSTVFMEGFKDGTTREDIEKALKLEFDVELASKAFTFVESVNGNFFAYVRFGEKNAAVVAFAKMKEKLTESIKFKIKGAEISFRVLEGNEETVYLNHTVKGHPAIKIGYSPQKSD